MICGGLVRKGELVRFVPTAGLVCAGLRAARAATVRRWREEIANLVASATSQIREMIQGVLRGPSASELTPKKDRPCH